MTLFVKLLSETAVPPEAGRLYSSEDASPADKTVRTGVSIKMPPNMRAVVQSPFLDEPCSVQSGVEIVLSKGDDEISVGQFVGNLVFSTTDVVVEGDAAEMGPIC